MKYCWYKTSTCCLERICIEPFFYTRGNVKSSSWKLMEDINVAVDQSSFIFAFIIKISALSNITLYRTFISVILVNSWSLKQLYIYIYTHAAFHFSLCTAPTSTFLLWCPSLVCLTAVWGTLSVFLYKHMLAQLNESPELTADGALWVWEAWSIHSVYSPCNLSSFLLHCLLPQDHREYSGPPSSVPSLRLCRRMSACSALGFLSRELVVVRRRAV